MNKSYYIGYENKGLKKILFMGSLEGSWYSDFQSAQSFSKPELKRVFDTVKRQNKDKKLKVIKINPIEEKI